MNQKGKQEHAANYEIILAISMLMIVLSLIWNLKVLLWIGLGIGLTSLILKPVAKLITVLWSYLIKALGYVNSRILLSVIFFLILFPISLIAKVFRNDDPLKRKKQEGSYYIERNHTFQPEDLKNPW